jgi:hypothetical protein
MFLRSATILLILLLSVGCKSKKDSSNDPFQLLLRFLVRNLNASGIDPELPSNVSVAVPRSIRKTSSGSSLSVKGKSFQQKDLSSLLADGNTGLGILQDGTTLIGLLLQDSKRDLVLLSSIFQRAKAAPGTCIPGGAAKIEVSELAITEFKEGLKRLGLSDEEASADLERLQSAGVLPTVGQSLPSPAIMYKVPSEKAYKHEVNFSFSESLEATKPCPANINATNAFEKTIRWNSDKSQIFSSIQKTIRFLTVSVTINASITYFTFPDKKDRAILATKQTTKIGASSSSEISKNLTVEECNAEESANSSNCISLSFKSKEKKSATQTIETTVIGKTDNEGGLVNTKITDTSLPAGDIEMDEYYDTNGNIVWLDYYVNYVYTSGFGVDNGNPYSFDPNNLFDGFVELVLDLGCISPSCIGENTPVDYSDIDFFVLAFNGDDPNTDDELIWGYGYYEDNIAASGGYNVQSEVEIIFYGDAEDVPYLSVWREKYDINDELIYVLVDDTVSLSP